MITEGGKSDSVCQQVLNPKTSVFVDGTISSATAFGSSPSLTSASGLSSATLDGNVTCCYHHSLSEPFLPRHRVHDWECLGITSASDRSSHSSSANNSYGTFDQNLLSHSQVGHRTVIIFSECSHHSTASNGHGHRNLLSRALAFRIHRHIFYLHP